jgi:hypothetical protein
MSGVRYPWQEPVLAALIELNTEKLDAKVGAALNSIEVRRAELNGGFDNHDERIALQDAFNSLNVVKRIAGKTV